MARRNDLRTSLVWTFAEALVTLLSALATAVVVARIVGPHDFGLASLALFVVSIAESVIAVSVTEALISRTKYDAEVADSAYTAMALSGFGAFALLCILAFPLAALYDAPELTPLIIVQAITLLLLGLRGVPEALLARKLRFRSLAMRGIIAKIASAVISVALAVWGAGEWSMILGNLAFAVAATTMIFFTMPRMPRIRWNFRHVKELLAFGRFTIAEAVCYVATPRLFAALVGYYGGVTAAGQIGIAFRVNDATAALISATTVRLALPVFSQLVKQPRAEFIAGVERGIRFTFFLAAPIFAGLALVSGDIIELVMGPAWADAKTSLITVCLFSVFHFSLILSGPLIKSMGSPGKATLVPAVGLATVVVAGTIVASYNVDYLFYLWIFVGFNYFTVNAWCLKSVAGMSYTAILNCLWLTAIACLLMAAVILLVEQQMAGFSLSARLALKIGTGAIVYGAFTLAFQREILRTILNRR